MIQAGDILTVRCDIITEGGLIVFNAGDKVKVRGVEVEEGHYSKLCPDIWKPERITVILLEDHMGVWIPDTFLEWNIGEKVTKTKLKNKKKVFNKKKFKSRLYINTIKGVINHPILNIPAYTFEEDDSYVECRRCTLISEFIPYQMEILKKLAVKSGTIIITAEQGIGKTKS